MLRYERTKNGMTIEELKLELESEHFEIRWNKTVKKELELSDDSSAEEEEDERGMAVSNQNITNNLQTLLNNQNNPNMAYIVLNGNHGGLQEINKANPQKLSN